MSAVACYLFGFPIARAARHHVATARPFFGAEISSMIRSRQWGLRHEMDLWIIIEYAINMVFVAAALACASWLFRLAGRVWRGEITISQLPLL
jgi:hypothetical protein